MVSTATLRHDAGARRVAMLSPLAVSPQHQRRGVGRVLVERVVSAAEALGEPLVVLEGDPAYYGPLGFEPADKYGIELPLPDWAPREAAQVIRLSSFDPDDLSWRGTVVYPEAFDGVE